MRMDKLYDRHRLTALDKLAFPSIAGSGGLADILMAIGHVDQELTSESYSFIRKYLAKYMSRDLSRSCRLDLGRFLQDVVFGKQGQRQDFVERIRDKLTLFDRLWEKYFDRVRRSFEERFGKIVVVDEDFHYLLRKLRDKRIADSTISSVVGSKKFEIREEDFTIVYGGEKYCLPDRYYQAVCLMARSQIDGNPSLRKHTIYDRCHVTSANIERYSVRHWFKNAGGEPRRFAEDGLIETGPNGTCRIPVPVDSIVINPLTDTHSKKNQ